MTENNVAVAVGSIPIVAKFIRSHIAKSAIIQSLRTKLMGSSDRGDSYGNTPNGPEASDNQDPRKPHTWKHPQADEFYELTDTNFMQTQVAAGDREESALAQKSAAVEASRSGINIVRTVSVTQQAKPDGKSQSLELLL